MLLPMFTGRLNMWLCYSNKQTKRMKDCQTPLYIQWITAIGNPKSKIQMGNVGKKPNLGY